MGGNLFGQLGDGIYVTAATPTRVGQSQLEAVAMGGFTNWLEPFPTIVRTDARTLKLERPPRRGVVAAHGVRRAPARPRRRGVASGRWLAV